MSFGTLQSKEPDTQGSVRTKNTEGAYIWGVEKLTKIIEHEMLEEHPLRIIGNLKPNKEQREPLQKVLLPKMKLQTHGQK
jgi:hypothetical protein